MQKERVRIADIAEELGLSTATVSNVIHGKTKKISEETVSRVQRLLEEKRYIPSMAGILLAQNSSAIIGVIVNNHRKYEKRVLQDPFIASSIDYLSEEIEQAGFFMMIKTAGDCNEIIRYASMWNMEGIVVIGFCEQDYEKLRRQMHIPFVVYDGYFQSINRYANIIADNLDGGYQMGKYLLEQGHKKILFLADNDICMDQERYLGLKKAGQEREEITIRRFLIPEEKKSRLVLYEASLQELLGYTAVFAASDQYAIELIAFLQQNKIRVPQDISVAGFDDIPQCEMIYPRLATIRQDGQKRAKTAMKLLKELKQGECQCMQKVLSVTLIPGESVKNIQI